MIKPTKQTSDLSAAKRAVEKPEPRQPLIPNQLEKAEKLSKGK